MRSTIFVIDVAPYGTEKAYGALYAAVVCLPSGSAVGLYGDGVYLALSCQESKDLSMPNLGDIVYAYPEVRFLAHEPSVAERGLMDKNLIEPIELLDEDEFIREIADCDSMIIL